VTFFSLVDELPEAELCAMRLDGECYRLAEIHVPIWISPDAAARCTAVLADRSPRLIAALGTAAWIWSAGPAVSGREEFLVDLDARWRAPFGAGVSIIESVVHPEDVTRFGRAGVTTPLRTALDLARFRDDFGDDEARIVRALAARGGFGLAEALQAMERTRNLARKREAATRLRAALSRS